MWTMGATLLDDCYISGCLHYNDVIMGPWRFKSPPSPLFTQPFIQAQIKENIKLRITGLCAGNSPVTGEFPTQRASNAEHVSIWRRHHIKICTLHDAYKLMEAKWSYKIHGCTVSHIIQSPYLLQPVYVTPCAWVWLAYIMHLSWGVLRLVPIIVAESRVQKSWLRECTKSQLFDAIPSD